MTKWWFRRKLRKRLKLVILVELVTFSKSWANISTTIHSVFGQFDLKLTKKWPKKWSKKKSMDSLCHSEWIWIWKNRFVLYWTQFPGFPCANRHHFVLFGIFTGTKCCKMGTIGDLVYLVPENWKHRGY